MPALAVLQRAEPGAQRAGLARGLGGSQDERPADEPVAFLTDVPEADAVGTGAEGRGEADVAGQVLGAGEALDVPELEHEQDGDERADPGDGPQARDAGIGSPMLVEVDVEGPNLAVQERQQRQTVFANRAG